MARAKAVDRIRFLTEQVFESVGPGKGPVFPAGFVLDSSDVSAVLGNPALDAAYSSAFLRRWVNRGVAEAVGADVAASDPGTIGAVGAAPVDIGSGSPESDDRAAFFGGLNEANAPKPVTESASNLGDAGEKPADLT